MKRILNIMLIAVLGSATLVSCNKKGCTDSACTNYDPEATKDDGTCECEDTSATITYTVPTTYNFENVDYSGQTARIAMLQEIVSYLKRGNTPGVVLSADTMKMMFDNSADVWSDTSLNSETKQIKNKTFELVQADYEGYLEWAEELSMDSSNVIFSNDSSKAYLMDTNGMEPTQYFEKGLFGAFLFHQIAGVYLSEEKIGNSVDNSTVTEGKGTPMEHHWDEAFGYFGVPIDFPTNTEGIYGISKYSNGRDALLSTNASIMNAFIKGRAAISNDDYETRDAQRVIIISEIEKVLAGTAIYYLNASKVNILDDALRNHALSEFSAFLGCLKYSPNATISDAKIEEIRAMVGSNFNAVTTTGLDNAKDAISTIYGLDSVKDDL